MKLTIDSLDEYHALIYKINMTCGHRDNSVLKDYGGVLAREFRGDIYVPASVQDCTNLLLEAHTKNRLTYRGAGHSMHGRSIPVAQNQLLVTSSLNQVSFCKDGFISVQAGVQIGVLQAFLNRFGWFLPIFPDAIHAGPTVAGYFLAGGFGSQSPQYGGFWDNVESITCILPGQSAAMEIHRSNDFFWNLSGSGGLINCFIYELKLVIKPYETSSIYPIGFTASLPTLQSDSSNPIIWFTLFTPLVNQNLLLRKYRGALSALSSVLQLVSPRRVIIKYLCRYPSLLAEFSDDLLAFSIGGRLSRNTLDSAISACQIIHALASSMASCVQYYSSELVLETLAKQRSH
jgi:hypothetical protein